MNGTFIQKFLAVLMIKQTRIRFEAIFASPNRHLTENSNWVPLNTATWTKRHQTQKSENRVIKL